VSAFRKTGNGKHQKSGSRRVSFGPIIEIPHQKNDSKGIVHADLCSINSEMGGKMKQTTNTQTFIHTLQSTQEEMSLSAKPLKRCVSYVRNLSTKDRQLKRKLVKDFNADVHIKSLSQSFAQASIVPKYTTRRAFIIIPTPVKLTPLNSMFAQDTSADSVEIASTLSSVATAQQLYARSVKVKLDFSRE
jgi:hypothetical protein